MGGGTEPSIHSAIVCRPRSYPLNRSSTLQVCRPFRTGTRGKYEPLTATATKLLQSSATRPATAG